MNLINVRNLVGFADLETPAVQISELVAVFVRPRPGRFHSSGKNCWTKKNFEIDACVGQDKSGWGRLARSRQRSQAGLKFWQRVYAAVARCPVSKLMTTSEVIVETVPAIAGV